MKPSLVYVTKLFEKTNTAPFWFQNPIQTVKHKIETTVTVVLDLKELKYNVNDKIEFNGEVFYTLSGKQCHLPIENVMLSSLDTMGEEFDVLASDKMDSFTMLARLATTEKTDLILRHIKNTEDQDSIRMDIFHRYLKMEQNPEGNIVIHRISPYHVLNGVMIIKYGESQDNRLDISVYSRSPSQVLALLYYIHDAIPLTIVATTPNYKITSKNNQLSDYNENIQNNASSCNYEDYLSSILDRSTTILEYLDNSMIKMGESKNPAVLNKVGTQIDLLALGADKYLEFRRKMLNIAFEGVKNMLEGHSVCIESDDIMVTDL